MAKTPYPLLCVLLFFISPAPTHGQTCIERTYLSQVGVREATNHNDGKAVEQYLQCCGLGEGYAWCAAFVKWCLLQCGVHTQGITAWAGTAHNAHNVVFYHQRFSKPPRAGDVFCLWDYNRGRVAHTGFFHRQVNESFYETVEGNTNEGGIAPIDGVYKHKRSYRATWSISRWD